MIMSFKVIENLRTDGLWRKKLLLIQNIKFKRDSETKIIV